VADSPMFIHAWDQHDAEQLTARLRLTYSQRLDWLWRAKLFAERARLAAEERRRSAADSRGRLPDGRPR